MSQSTGIIRDDLYKEHLADYPHPESPQRLEAIYDMLDSEDIGKRLLLIPPRSATYDELAWIHSRSYIERVALTDGVSHMSLDPDTQTTPLSYKAAILAAGGLFSLIDKIFDGTVRNGFALVRPPGHHAERDRAMGFCLFNNVALAAMYAHHKYSIKRTLIVDWDLHHGNATQHSFYTDPKVLYFSTHQYPYYPGSGGLTEVGDGDGAGYTVNVPLSAGQGDREFFAIFKQLLCPIARAFKPELVLVSAGFDTYAGDPLGSMRVTPQGFAALTRVLMDIAGEYASDRIAMTLEGGYNLTGLRDSVRAVLKELMQESILTDSDLQTLESGPALPIIDEVVQVQKLYWPLS